MENQKFPADPYVVFFASAFVGATIGPSLIKAGREVFQARSHEIAGALVDRFMDALKSNIEQTRVAA